MLRYLVLLVVLLWPAAAGAVEIGAVSEAVMAERLEGCWRQEITPMEQRFERHGSSNSHELCFGPKGKLGMWSVASSKYNFEGFEAYGRYELKASKLVMVGELADGWLFDTPAVSCDVLASEGRAIKLYGCTGGENPAHVGARPLADTSYELIPADCWSRDTTVICLDNAGWVTTFYRGITESFDYGGTYTEAGGKIRFVASDAVGEGWPWDEPVVECRRGEHGGDLVLIDCSSASRGVPASFTLEPEKR
jgi:hypothetical protein